MRVEGSDYTSRMSRSPRGCRCRRAAIATGRKQTRASTHHARTVAAMPRSLFTVLALAAFTAAIAADTCARDGLHADYDAECREYYRCLNGVAIARYVCKYGRGFSEAVGACVPHRRQACVRRACGSDSHAYAAPGTACRHYYRCVNGSSQELACPSGAWFDWAHQACTRGAGTCFEPLCIGLPDGDYPDASIECHRTLRCRGGEIDAVVSCGGGLCAGAETCPPARTSSVPIPAGSADFCSDEACSSLCREAEDGAHPDRATGCREYYVCESRRVTRRGVCDPGLLFSNGRCTEARRVTCQPPARSPCFNRPDGLHRDWRDCSSWFECRRERVASRGACPNGLVFDEANCVSSSRFFCEGPKRAVECEGRPSGMYHLATNCTHYFHCEGPLQTLLSCGAGRIWDGARCSPVEEGYVCPSLEVDSCVGLPDGRYKAPEAGCRGYIACAAGERTNYACPSGQVFNGDACVRAAPGTCADDDASCAKRTDGYHADLNTNCRRYYYCQGGDRLATLSCQGGKIFDGRTCVDAGRHRCGQSTIPATADDCRHDGFFLQPGTSCERYYFCVTGEKTSLNCPAGRVFNGQVCVPKSQYTCTG